MSKYSEKFKDPRWQQKRLRILERDDWQCKSCGDRDKTLNVHHIFYDKGKNPWEYDDDILITWCEACHSARHKLQKQILKGISEVTIYALKDIMPIIEDRMLLLALARLSSCITPDAIKQLVDVAFSISNDSYSNGFAAAHETGVGVDSE